MDQTGEYYKKRKLQMALQFIVSISLLSVLFSHSSMLCYYFHYLKFQVSTLILPLFTHTIERKYMFLLCNGILAIVVKSSSSSSSLTKGINQEDVKPVMSEIESSLRSTENFPPLHEQEEEEKLNGSLVTEVKEVKNGDLIIYSTEENEVEQSGWSLVPASSLLEEEEEEEEEEEDNEEVKLSTEELNRKFDEFIRKIKEEIRIEAQRQLIAV